MRQRIIIILLVFSFISCKKDAEEKQVDKGCFYNTGSSQQLNLGNTFNNVANDAQFQAEVALQNAFWNLGYPITVYVWYGDSPPNAMADPDKKIYYGFNLFYYTVPMGDYAVDGILAHEWGHQLQFKYGWRSTQSNLVSELEADAFSGWYIAMNRNWVQSQMNGYFQQAFNSGSDSYDYNNPTFHGTHKQRFEAAKMGIDFGLATKNNVYIWNQLTLHEAFKTNIQNVIIPNP